MSYEAPWWLPGGNLQTIWSAKLARRFHGPAPAYRRERWRTPDGDFVDVDWLVDSPVLPEHGLPPGAAGRPLLVLFHGLEGSSRSHYSEAFAHFARSQGLAYAVPHFRGCSGELNQAPRAYHSGDHEEIGWMLERFRQAQPGGPLLAVGVSLGGNALMRWAGEAGVAAATRVQAIASVCSPLNLAASGEAIGRGFNRQVYTRMFLQTMKPKALRKWEQHPGLFDRDALRRARDLREFDDAFTAPLHGFAGVDDYYARASAAPVMHRILVPALAVNAGNDPFVPVHSLPGAAEVGSHVSLWRPDAGGHVGFAAGGWPGDVGALPDRVGRWLLSA